MNIFDENSHDQYLRQKLDNNEFLLPASAWDDMQARLDEVAITNSDEALRQQVAAQNLPPPAFAWDNMQAMLEQANIDKSDEALRQQVASQNFPPPAFAWDDMQATLDKVQPSSTENQLRQQVAQHQWTLPAFAWAQLDNQLETQSLQEKVVSHQFQMPSNAWDNMEQKLNLAAQRRKRKAIFWYCAAAASLLFFTTTAIYYGQPTTTNTQPNQLANNQNNNNQNENQLTSLIINSITKSLPLFNNSTYSNQGTVTNTVANPQIISPSAAIAQQNNDNNSFANTKANTNNIKANSANTNLANTNLANTNSANTNLANHANPIAEACLPVIHLPTISPQPLSNHQFIEEPILIEKGSLSPWQANVWIGLTTKVLQGSNKVAVSPVIGIGATYQIDAHNKFVAGLQYKQISPQGSFSDGLTTTFIDNNPAQEANRNNSMNLVADANDEPKADIYQLNKINMIELPLAYHYQINKKQAVQIGTKVGFIANISASRQNPQQMPALTLNRYDVGIGVVNMAATLAYEYRFNRNMAINVQYTAGFSNLMASAQRKYRAYGSFWGQDAAAGQVYMLLADNKPAPPILVQTPDKMLNNDLQVALRFNF